MFGLDDSTPPARTSAASAGSAELAEQTSADSQTIGFLYFGLAVVSCDCPTSRLQFSLTANVGKAFIGKRRHYALYGYRV